MDLDGKFELFVSLLKPLESKICPKDIGRNKQYWIKLTAHTISNWCWFEERYLNEHTVEELVDIYNKHRDLKQRASDGL
jgi:hypothetical protein